MMVVMMMTLRLLLQCSERFLGTGKVSGLQVLADLLQSLCERSASLGCRRL
jgi:hypothetical protein